MTLCRTPERGTAGRLLPDPHDHRAGFILIATLWILAGLAALAWAASTYLVQSAVALSAKDDMIQTDAAIRTALELTAYGLSVSPGKPRPTRGSFRFQLAGADVTAEFVSEAARLNINMAPKALIAGFFAALGAAPDAAEEYAERVVKWRTRPQPDAADAEDALYQSAGLAYYPRRAPFNHVEELWLVKGLSAALVERALPHVTIYSGMRDINVLDAAPEVIAALPGMSPARLNAFLGQRESLPADPTFIATALGDKQVGATMAGSDAYRVRMVISSQVRRTTADIVIMIYGPAYNDPYRVLSWKYDIDPASGRDRPPTERR